MVSLFTLALNVDQMEIKVCADFVNGAGIDCEFCGTLNRPSKDWNYVGCKETLSGTWIWMEREDTGRGNND